MEVICVNTLNHKSESPQPIPGGSRGCDSSQAGLQVLHGAVDISFQNYLTISRLFPDKNAISLTNTKPRLLFITPIIPEIFVRKFVSIRSDHFCRRFSVIGRTEICRSLPIRIILVFLV